MTDGDQDSSSEAIGLILEVEKLWIQGVAGGTRFRLYEYPFFWWRRTCAASWKNVNQKMSSHRYRMLSWMSALVGVSHRVAP